MRPFLALAAFVAPLTLAATAHAFCGFYVSPGDEPLTNDASLVALMRDGSRTVMSMSNDYRGPLKDFAMVVPVPIVLKQDDVRTLPHDVFKHIETLTAPRLVEYWEHDPCDHPCADVEPGGAGCGQGFGYGGGSGKVGSGSSVKVEAQFAVGEYQIVILGADDSDGLEAWLHTNGYAIPKGASAALAPYVKEQQKFFVAKVDPKKVTLDASGAAVLSPLRIAFESADLRLPVRLGLLNAPKPGQGKQDLIVWLLSQDTRFDVANYPNVFVPTNLDVDNAVRTSFASFYAELFDKAIAKGNGRAIVTEYAWTSSSCDPCPTPPLADKDVATLGGDVFWPGPKGGMTRGHPMVITRLHARYDASTLGDDLVFRAAPPIEGGREWDEGKSAVVSEKGAARDNNFQARYVIRHEWTGPIACQFPERGRWEGPPEGGAQKTAANATGLAAAPRGKTVVEDVVVGGVPAFTLANNESLAGPAPSATPSDAGVDDASFGGGTVPAVPPGERGCGCSTPGERAASGGLFALALVGAAAVIARRRSVPRDG